MNVAVVGTANVLQTVAFIAEHERSTHVKYFVLADDAPPVSDKIKFIGRDQLADVVRGLDVVFVLTALTDAATCKTTHLIADCVKNENVWLTVAVVQSASVEFTDELRHLEKNFGVVINLAEQQFNQTPEDFSYKIVHGIHSVYDDDFYPYLMPVDGTDLLDLLTRGRKTFVGFGEASGENPTVAAVKAALDSPIIKNNLQSARSVFLNVMGSYDSLLMMEVNRATTPVYEATKPDGEFYWGVNLDESLAEKIFVMIIVRVPES